MTELSKFDPASMREPQLRSMEVEGVGVITYAPLSTADYIELRKMPAITDDEMLQQGAEIAYRMLKPACPELVREDMMKWPMDTLMKVIGALAGAVDFRGTKPASTSGPPTMQPPSGSSATNGGDSPTK